MALLGATLGMTLAIVAIVAGRWRTQAPSRADAPASWGQYWVRMGLLSGLGAPLGTAILVSGYWICVGPPSSIRETGSELARQTLSILGNPFFFGLVGVFALLLWGPTLLYSRMHEKAIRTHAIGALTVGLGLTGVFGYFVGVPPIPRNAQAGIGLLLFSAAGLVLYLLVLGATVVQHVWGSSGSG